MAHFKGSEEDFNREREGMNIRMRQQFEFEEIKKKLKEESNRGLVTLNQQFSKADLTSVDNFKSETIGLVSADEFRRKRKKLLQNNQSEKKIDEKKTNFKNKIEEENRLLKNKIKNTLSFDPFQSEDEPTATNSKKLNFKKKKSLKNPNVDTSFLPDKERDKRDAELRSKLKRKWIEKQELIKNEKIEIIYVYWDGSGHRKKITIEKGKTIGNFLEIVKERLSDVFMEFKSVPTDELLYVKSDSIIPHNYTFYELIATKALGKSGSLFILDEAVEEIDDFGNKISVQRDECHCGKVVIRSWYDRNIHMYPASNWDNFREKEDDEI